MSIEYNITYNFINKETKEDSYLVKRIYQAVQPYWRQYYPNSCKSTQLSKTDVIDIFKHQKLESVHVITTKTELYKVDA